jgi:HEAT repeats
MYRAAAPQSPALNLPRLPLQLLLCLCGAMAACNRVPAGATVIGKVAVSEGNLASAPELGATAEQATQALRKALEATGKFAVRDERPTPGSATTARVRLDIESARRVVPPQQQGLDREMAEVVVSLELMAPDSGGELDRLVAEGSGRKPTATEAGSAGDPQARLAAFEGALALALQEAATSLTWQLEDRRKSDAALQKDLAAPDPRVRDYAIRALADRRNPAAVPLLLGRLDDESPDVVRRAMGALVAIGDQRAVRPLVELTRKRPPQFVAEVLYAIGSLGGAEAEAYLYTMESGAPEEEVRRAASDALGELRRRREETAGSAAKAAPAERVH